MNNPSQKSKFSSLLVLILLLLVFISPIFLAKYFYEHRITLGKKPRNLGHLLHPSFSISKLQIYNQQGTLLANNSLLTNGKWIIVLLQDGHCDKKCEQDIFYLRQIRIATGKDAKRVGRAILVFKNIPHQKVQMLIAKKYQGTQLLLTEKHSFTNVMQQYLKADYSDRSGTIYIVDPIGNIILAYQPNENRIDILKDLKLLLRASQIG